MTNLLILGLTAVTLSGIAIGGSIVWAQCRARVRMLESQLVEARAELANERQTAIALHADLVEANANRARSNT